MRVGLVVAGGFDPSGRERVIPALLWLVERLACRHAVHVFVLNYFREPCTYELAGATVHDLGRVDAPRGSASLVLVRKLLKRVREVGPFDLLHGYWAVPSGVVAAAAARRLGIPSVVTFDSGELVSVRECGYGLQGSVRQRTSVVLAARLATRLHVCSDYMLDLARRKGLDADRIPLGVDTEIFCPCGGPPPGPPWRLIHVASLRPVKDETTLIGAMALLAAARGDRVHLDIVGEDTGGGVLQAACAARGLSRQVTFHGFRPTSELAPLYRRAHLHVQSSRHEAAGVVVLEAAACGVPTVGTATGYVADWAPQAAAAVEPGNPEALAGAIGALLDDPWRRAALGQEGARRAEGMSADRTAIAMEALYAGVLGRR